MSRKKIRLVGESVRSSKWFTGDMDHFETKVSKVNQPPCLTVVGCLELSEVGEVLVIGEHLYQNEGSMKVMLPGFQGVDDCKEFLVIDVIVPFSERESLREVGAWVPFPIRVSLEKDGTRCVF